MTIEDRAIDPARPIAAEHVRQYLESNGASVDHPAAGHLILLYTTGRASGQIRRTPLRFFEVGDDLVVAGSYGGAPEHPEWYFNLVADPTAVMIQDGPDLITGYSFGTFTFSGSAPSIFSELTVTDENAAAVAAWRGPRPAAVRERGEGEAAKRRQA